MRFNDCFTIFQLQKINLRRIVIQIKSKFKSLWLKEKNYIPSYKIEYALFHVEQTKNYLPWKTINTETSEGEIPLILEACPIVAG